MELFKTKEDFIEMRAQGYSLDKIAKKLGKSKNTLIVWSKELQGEIANCKAIELEALCEKYYLHKEGRLQIFGSLLVKIKEEIERRDFLDIPTDKLLDLFLKYSNKAKDELTIPIYKSLQEIKEEKAEKQLISVLTNINVED
jgi:hypothetical protein